MDKEIILALDQATRTSGWAVYIDKELKDYGHWTEKDKDLGKRTYNLINNIQKVITKFHPSKIFFENIQLKKDEGIEIGVSTFQKLAQIQGAIILLCELNKIPYEIVYPSEWRKQCNFLKNQDKSRKSQKKIAQEWIKIKYGFDCTSDEADAICIGYYGITKKDQERDSIDRIDWA